jgi:hypothetical protein
MAVAHDFGWMGVCRFCGATQEAVEDNVASPNCDIIRHVSQASFVIPVTLGVLISLALLVGMF